MIANAAYRPIAPMDFLWFTSAWTVFHLCINIIR